MKFLKLVVIITFCICFSSGVYSQTEEDCVNSKCHTSIADKEFVHGPVGAKICTICHLETNKKDHLFSFTSDKEELCFGCHENNRDMMMQNYLHTPVADGNCTGCHDPHASDYRFSLKGTASQLCFTCHKKDSFSDKFVHGPVSAGDCNACHDPHASEHSQQLRSSSEELCILCHKEKDTIMASRHIHKPVSEKCTNCHSPHANASKFLLAKAQPDLCYGCHADMIQYNSVEFAHSPVNKGKCMDCHNVHASNNPKMFQKPQQQLCFSCHEDTSTDVIAASYKHGPTKEGDCNACHNPHGSDNTNILRKRFPKEFYNSYSTDNYAICFECHNKDIALDEETSTLTNFRNGNQNLHFLHVNKEEKGRSCKACHQVHASSQEKHIRESVPYGAIKWELPIKYSKFDNGGYCVVGCHAPKEYIR